MSELKDQTIRDMEIRGLSKSTQRAYLGHIKNFSRHYGKSPEGIHSKIYPSYTSNGVCKDKALWNIKQSKQKEKIKQT